MKIDIKLGLGGLLTVIFTVLKLTGLIAWSWWWVLSPTWVPLVLMGLIMVVLVIVTVLGG